MTNVVSRAREEARRLHADGEHWLVYELPASYDRRGPSLVFEADTVVRRVRDFPSPWRELSDADLAHLMSRA